jgi:hypothetical protein
LSEHLLDWKLALTKSFASLSGGEFVSSCIEGLKLRPTTKRRTSLLLQQTFEESEALIVSFFKRFESINLAQRFED